MQTLALLPLSLLGTFSIFCAVLCDNSSSGFPNFTLQHAFTYINVESNLRDSIYLNYSLHDVEFYLSSQWLTKFVPSVYTVVFIVALPLNLIAILMFRLKIKIKMPAIIYMLNLATADLLFVTMLPFSIVYRFSGNNWQIGDGMCRIVVATFYCNMYCSILLMMSMSVDRYMAVVFPIRSLTWRSKKQAWLVCGVIWLVSMAGTAPLLINKQTANIESLNITTCHDVVELEDQQNFYMYYFTTFSSIFFWLPLIITVFCYTEIVRTLSKSSKNIGNSSKKTRAIILTIIVLSLFIICFAPTNIILLMHYLGFRHGFSHYLYITYLLCGCISSISNCLDPLIYYYASSTCRNYVSSLLCHKMSDKLQTEHQLQTPKQSCTERSFVK